MPFDDWMMRPITDAARIVKASLSPSHGFELADLVSIGVERVLRYLGGSEAPTSSVLVFVCAKQGMLMEARRWVGREIHGLERKSPDPTFCEYDDARDVAYWDQWQRFALPIESMIDIKRALLDMKLREAVSWYSHHWLGEPMSHLEGELGVGAGRIQQYCRAALDRLQAVAPVQHEAQPSRAPRHVDKRERYAALRRLGATPDQARNGSKGVHAFATMCRQLEST